MFVPNSLSHGCTIYIDQARHGKFPFVKANYDGWPPHLAAGFSFCHELTVLFEIELKATYVYIVKVLPDPGVPLVTAFFKVGCKWEEQNIVKTALESKADYFPFKKEGNSGSLLECHCCETEKNKKRLSRASFTDTKHLGKRTTFSSNLVRQCSTIFYSITQLVNVSRMSGKSRFYCFFP